MSVVSQVATIRCDAPGCKATETGKTSIAALRRRLRDAESWGWASRGSRSLDFCPKHIPASVPSLPEGHFQPALF